MTYIQELLELTKEIALEAGNKILTSLDLENLKKFKLDDNNAKEIKAKADKYLEKEIFSRLEGLEVPILSEESGLLSNDNESDFIFIVDPLDGTFNFVKGSGPSSISIALWQRGNPVFGVIFNLYNGQLSWGGKEIGSFCEKTEMKISNITDPSKAVICSGFPSRFKIEDKNNKDLFNVFKNFLKVRMIGSASLSLNHVANGTVDAYLEKDIMLWDVAAGIAIVEGAGGKVHMLQKETEYSLDVTAANKDLLKKIVNE